MRVAVIINVMNYFFINKIFFRNSRKRKNDALVVIFDKVLEMNGGFPFTANK